MSRSLWVHSGRFGLAALLGCLAAAAITTTACSHPPSRLAMRDGAPTTDGRAGDAGASSADAAAPLPPQCDPLVPRYCMLPWPSSFYLRADAASATGWRLSYPRAALPASRQGTRFDPARYNLLDGFSPSSQPIAYFEGGVSADGLPGEADDPARTLDAASPVQIIDFVDGTRVPLFAEVDHGALSAATAKAFAPGLLIHPLRRLRQNRRYIVVLRLGIEDRDGKVLTAPPLFRRIRDGEALGDDPTAVAAGARLAPVLAAVVKHGVPRRELLLAWDFHTASAASTTASARFMVDDALARIAKSGGPSYTITKTTDKPSGPTLREIDGTMRVPSYLVSDDPDATLSLDAAGKPRYRGEQSFGFRVHVPRCAAKAGGPLPIQVFGHGLFGAAKAEMSTSLQRNTTERLCMVQVGTDWIGLSAADIVALAKNVVPDLTKLPRLTDRLLQAQVNIATLVELVRGKLLADPAMAVGGSAVSDGKTMVYYGISNGAIQGVAFAALSNRIERFVLQVGGGPWSLMIQRSSHFKVLDSLLAVRYPDPLHRVLLLHITQSLWDAIDPTSFARHVRDDPLPGRKPKRVLYQEAKYDDQVPNAATRVLARELGLPLLTPRHEVVYGITERAGPLTSAYVQWDMGMSWRPLPGNQPPRAPDFYDSAHELLRYTEGCKRQLEAFFLPSGMVVHTCAGPCANDLPARP